MRLVVDAAAADAQSLGLLLDGKIVRGVDHRFALRSPALVSAPSKKSFSRVSAPILACSVLRSTADAAGSVFDSPPKTPTAPSSNWLFHCVIWLACTSNCSANSDSVFSPLMAVGRLFAGRIVAHISPVTLLLDCTLLSAAGLLGLGTMHSRMGIFLAATSFAAGVCYCWPTMYGITSERFPAGGAFLLALIGSVGMLSDAFVVPLMGRMYDVWGPNRALRSMAVLPVIVAAVFALIALRDRANGGYRTVQLSASGSRGILEN